MAGEMGSLRVLADATAAVHADDVVLVEPVSGRATTYAELIGRAVELGDHLEALGARPGDRVALTVAGRVELAELLFGVMYGGYCAVPIDTTWTADRIDAAIERVGARLVLSEPPTDSGPPPRHRTRPLDGPSPHAEALLMFTSGSTGTPKGVVMTQANLVACAANTAASHQLGPTDRFMCVLPLWHMNSVDKLLGTIATGGRVVLPPRFAVADFWDWVEADRCTWMALVPTIVAQLVRRAGGATTPSRATLERIRFARCSSAPLAPALRDEFVGLFDIPLLEGMGMTEAGSVFLNPPGAAKPGSVGTAVGIETRLVDETGSPVADGTVGTLQIRGPSLMKGYDDPEATEAAFDGAGWFSTGDLAHRDDDGYFFVVGRSKEIVIKAGVNIAPREIDDVLTTHPDVAEAATAGVDDDMLGQDIESYVVPRHGGFDIERLTAELLDLCVDRLGVLKTPRAIHVVADLPRGPSGKAQPLRLAPAAALADVEVTLTRLWSELLERDEVPVDADFFDIGGYSLLALEAAYQTRRALGIQFSLATFFEHPTIAGQAAHIRTATATGRRAGHVAEVSTILLNPGAGDSAATPLFCAYGPYQYRALARHLGDRRPVYGTFADTESEISGATTADDEAIDMPTVEQLAALYLGAVREVQESGPYLLAGYSFGGRVAFEMAQQLRREGEDVARLFVLDTYLAGEASSRLAEVGVLVRRAARMGPAAVTRRILRRPADHGEQARTARAYRAQARYREWARDQYHPEPYPGDAVLLRATDAAAGRLGRRQDALLGWGDVVTGALAVHDVPTDHVGLVREPAVAVLADHIRSHLGGVD